MSGKILDRFLDRMSEDCVSCVGSENWIVLWGPSSICSTGAVILSRCIAGAPISYLISYQLERGMGKGRGCRGSGDQQESKFPAPLPTCVLPQPTSTKSINPTSRKAPMAPQEPRGQEKQPENRFESDSGCTGSSLPDGGLDPLALQGSTSELLGGSEAPAMEG